MPQPPPRTFHGRRDRPEPTTSSSMMDTGRISFTKPLDAELFNVIAQEVACSVAENTRSNKPTQLRRFYDELLLWESRVARYPEKFQDYLPFIRMINAKVAYARGRNQLVDDRFVTLMQHTLQEVTDANSPTTCKLFWEAFMGFYKKERPSD